MAEKITLTLAEVEAAEAALLQAKKTGSKYRVKEAKNALAPLRQAYRAQEEAAGRREFGPGGDAVKVGG